MLLHAQAFHGRDKGQNISRQEGQLVSGWIVNTLPTVQDIQDRDRIWEELKKNRQAHIHIHVQTTQGMKHKHGGTVSQTLTVNVDALG